MIRPVGLFDIPMIGKLQHQGLQLDPRRALTKPESPLVVALRAPLSLSPTSSYTFVAQADQAAVSLAGFVQLRCRKHRRSEADVTYISPALGPDAGIGQLWSVLLDAIAWEAGRSGVQRIFANLPADSEDTIPFLNAGFVIFTVEELFVLEQRSSSQGASVQEDDPLPDAAQVSLRHQVEADTWALQRLYSAIVPLGVKQAEGLCDTRGTQADAVAWVARPEGESYVLERQGDVVGHLEVIRGRIGHWAHFALHPQAVDLASHFLAAGLRVMGEQDVLPIYTHVRSYAHGLKSVLASRGFQMVERREMAVRQTTVRVHEPATAGIRVLEPRAEVSATPTLVRVVHTDGMGRLGGRRATRRTEKRLKVRI